MMMSPLKNGSTSFWKNTSSWTTHHSHGSCCQVALTSSMKRFSLSASFSAMPSPKSICDLHHMGQQFSHEQFRWDQFFRHQSEPGIREIRNWILHHKDLRIHIPQPKEVDLHNFYALKKKTDSFPGIPFTKESSRDAGIKKTSSVMLKPTILNVAEIIATKIQSCNILPRLKGNISPFPKLPVNLSS